MSEKIMSRQKLDHMIELVREVCETPYDEGNVKRLCQECTKVGQAIEAEADRKIGLMWSAPYNLVWEILHGGLKKGATNKDIYQVLEVLGWEVQDEA